MGPHFGSSSGLGITVAPLAAQVTQIGGTLVAAWPLDNPWSQMADQILGFYRALCGKKSHIQPLATAWKQTQKWP